MITFTSRGTPTATPSPSTTDIPGTLYSEKGFRTFPRKPCHIYSRNGSETQNGWSAVAVNVSVASPSGPSVSMVMSKAARPPGRCSPSSGSPDDTQSALAHTGPGRLVNTSPDRSSGFGPDAPYMHQLAVASPVKQDLLLEPDIESKHSRELTRPFSGLCHKVDGLSSIWIDCSSSQSLHDLRLQLKATDITRQHQGLHQASRIVCQRIPCIKISPPYVFRRREKNTEVNTISHKFFCFSKPFLEPLDQEIIRPPGNRELITRTANPNNHSPIFLHERAEFRIAHIHTPGQSTWNTLHHPSNIR